MKNIIHIIFIILALNVQCCGLGNLTGIKGADTIKVADEINAKKEVEYKANIAKTNIDNKSDNMTNNNTDNSTSEMNAIKAELTALKAQVDSLNIDMENNATANIEARAELNSEIAGTISKLEQKISAGRDNNTTNNDSNMIISIFKIVTSLLGAIIMTLIGKMALMSREQNKTNMKLQEALFKHGFWKEQYMIECPSGNLEKIAKVVALKDELFEKKFNKK